MLIHQIISHHASLTNGYIKQTRVEKSTISWIRCIPGNVVLQRRGNNLLQYSSHLDPVALALRRLAVNLVNHPVRLVPQLRHHLARVRKAARPLHVLDRVQLDFLVRWFLPQDVDELQIARVCPDAVDDGEREFALR